MIQTIAAAGASDLAYALWNRYCDFTEVYRLSMEELAGDLISTSTEKSAQEPQRTRPPARRASASMDARQTKAVSSRKRSGIETTKQEAV